MFCNIDLKSICKYRDTSILRQFTSDYHLVSCYSIRNGSLWIIPKGSALHQNVRLSWVSQRCAATVLAQKLGNIHVWVLATVWCHNGLVLETADELPKSVDEAPPSLSSQRVCRSENRSFHTSLPSHRTMPANKHVFTVCVCDWERTNPVAENPHSSEAIYSSGTFQQLRFGFRRLVQRLAGWSTAIALFSLCLLLNFWEFWQLMATAGVSHMGQSQSQCKGVLEILEILNMEPMHLGCTTNLHFGGSKN